MSLRPGSSGSTSAARASAAVRSDLLGLVSGAPVTPPVVAPTVVITDNIAGTTATGPITFTFTFSEAVTGFTVDDVVANASVPNPFVPEAPPSISAATKSSFTAVSPTVYTVVVTPPYSVYGTIQVQVPSSAATSVSSGQGNAASALATQGFNLENVTPPEPPEPPPEPEILVELAVVASEAQVVAAGQVVTFTATVTNLSEVSTQVTVVSSLGGTLATNAALPTAQNAVYSYQYTVTEADVAAGSVVETVTATGGTSMPTQTVTLPVVSALAVNTTASATAVYSAGDAVIFTVNVANTGPVPVTGITVTTSLGATLATNVSLNPSQSVAYTQSYTLTQPDVDSGSVAFSATAASVRTVSASDSTTKLIEASAELIVNSNVVTYLNRDGTAGNGDFSPGDKIKYQILVANTGTTTLTNVVVSVTNASLSDTSAVASLAPGASFSRYAYHLVPYPTDVILDTGSTTPDEVYIYSSYSSQNMLVTVQSSETSATTTQVVEWNGEPMTYPELLQVQTTFDPNTLLATVVSVIGE